MLLGSFRGFTSTAGFSAGLVVTAAPGVVAVPRSSTGGLLSWAGWLAHP
jgi:hypothetical protein